jgi:hypothetical protein
LVEALCYKPERRGFDSRRGQSFFLSNWPYPSSRNIALGSIHLLAEMNTRILPGGEARSVSMGDNLTAICEPIV